MLKFWAAKKHVFGKISLEIDKFKLMISSINVVSWPPYKFRSDQYVFAIMEFTSTVKGNYLFWGSHDFFWGGGELAYAYCNAN